LKSIFISYSREDKKVAQTLASLLEKEGYEVWWDQHISAGQNFRDLIETSLNSAEIVIVIWSSHSIRSAFVIDEAQRAAAQDKLVPVVIDVSDPPMGFGHLHYLQAKDIQSEFEAICDAIEGRIPQSTPKTIRTNHKQKIVIASMATIIIGIGGWVTAQYVFPEKCQANGLDATFDYVCFDSQKLGITFAYPQAKLTLDTTQEGNQKIPLMAGGTNSVEVIIERSPLPEHNNIRIGRRIEKEKLEKLGWQLNYIGPRKEKNWSNWYVLTGWKKGNTVFYYRRWYTDKAVFSFMFEYPEGKTELYTKIIPAMTLKNVKFHK